MELISNACLYNIVFINNLPPYLKNSGSATGDAKATKFYGRIKTCSDLILFKLDTEPRSRKLFNSVGFSILFVAPSRRSGDHRFISGSFLFYLCKRESPPSIMVTRKPNWSFRDSKARDWLRKGKVLAPLVRPT